jgi:ATP-binding cassette subfamily E protein 1
LQRLRFSPTPADVYLIDEPSAYLDPEQRINCAKVDQTHQHSKKRRHLLSSMTLSWRLIRRPSCCLRWTNPELEATASSPQSLLRGNESQFLKSLEVTFRRDPTNFVRGKVASFIVTSNVCNIMQP